MSARCRGIIGVMYAKVEVGGDGPEVIWWVRGLSWHLFLPFCDLETGGSGRVIIAEVPGAFPKLACKLVVEIGRMGNSSFNSSQGASEEVGSIFTR